MRIPTLFGSRALFVLWAVFMLAYFVALYVTGGVVTALVNLAIFILCFQLGRLTRKARL